MKLHTCVMLGARLPRAASGMSEIERLEGTYNGPEPDSCGGMRLHLYELVTLGCSSSYIHCLHRQYNCSAQRLHHSVIPIRGNIPVGH